MTVYKTRNFTRWALKVGLSDNTLIKAFQEMQVGLFDANLGGGIIKKRVALPGRGKRGSTRTLLVTNLEDRWIYVFGFEKNDRDNISAKELEALRILAGDLLRLSTKQIGDAIKNGSLVEVYNEKDKA